MDPIIFSAIISALLSASISALISNNIAAKNNIRSEKARLNEQILSLNKILIKHPYLDDDDFCKTWPQNRTSKDKKYMRYESYCCIVFNLLEQIYKLFNGDEKKIEEFFYAKELIKRHNLWWNNPSDILENIDGYNHEFREYLKKNI